MKRMTWMRAAVIVLAGVLAGAPPAAAHAPPAAGSPVVTIRRDANAAFTPDGTRMAAEYPEAAGEFLDLTGGTLAARVYVKRFRSPMTQDEELRIYFVVNDTDGNTLDRIDFHFDRLHDHGAGLQDDRMLRIKRTGCGMGACAAQLFSRDGGDLFTVLAADVNLPDAIVNPTVNTGEFPGPGNRWVGELVLRPSHLGWGYFPASVGLLVVARSADAGTPRGWFPSTSPNGDELLPANWSDVRLRYPIDFALSLDYSGSMLETDGLTENRWLRAKRAADLFAAALGLFKDPAFLDDRIGVSQYSWSCFDDSNAGNTTGQPLSGVAGPALGSIPPPPTGVQGLTAGNNTLPPGANCTPIRQGLEFALNTQLGFSVPALQDRKDRVVVLLSDGFHNTPNAHVPFVPAAVFNADQTAFANVGTVALGPDGSAGTLLLSQIATHFQGTMGIGRYNQTSQFAELMESYLEVLQEPFAINAVPEMGGSFATGAVDKIVFIGVWNTPAQASNLRVQRGADPVVTGTVSNTRIGYAAATVAGTDVGGSWTFLVPEGGTPPDQRYVLVDLRTLARFPVEQRDYVTGEPILLRVALTDAGAPLPGADARVEIARPGEGLGNVLSTLQPSCEIGIPHIPQVGGAHTGIAASSTVPPPAAGAAGAAGAGDPPPGRYALAASLFEKCGKPGLDRDTLAGERMYDDGTHGDATPGDGVYSLLYGDTNLEGSYNFRFNVRGTAPDGMEFARTRRFSQFVQVQPTPEHTQHVVQSGGVIGGMQTAVYWFLPRDRFENYLGPGFADVMRVSVPYGALGGPLYDAGNGWYGQQVRWPGGAPPPPVRVELPINGFVTTLGPSGTGGDFPGVAAGTGRSEWEIFGSWTMLDDTLDVDDALGLGIRFAAPLGGPLRFELEGATTFPELGDDSVRVSQLFAGLRAEVALAPAVLASLSAGGGVMHFSGGGASETTGAGHASGALTLLLSPHFGIRGTGRLLYVGDVRGAGEATTGTQLTVGVVFRP